MIRSSLRLGDPTSVIFEFYDQMCQMVFQSKGVLLTLAGLRPPDSWLPHSEKQRPETGSFCRT